MSSAEILAVLREKLVAKYGEGSLTLKNYDKETTSMVAWNKERKEHSDYYIGDLENIIFTTNEHVIKWLKYL